MMNILLETWATTMWRACWQGGLVVLVVWSICRLIPSMPARFQCWLWWLAILKFMVVLVVPWFLNVPLLPARSVAAHDVSLQAARVMPAATEVSVSPPDQLEVRSKAIDRSKAIELPILRTILCFAWIIGVTWGLTRLLVALYGTMRLRRRGHSTACMSLVEQLAIQGKLFGFRSLPKLLEIDGDGSPMLIGIFRPTILMPATTLGRLSRSERNMVLGHELAHIRRGDLLWGLIASLARAVFFFHPLVWLGERQLKLTQEVAADELAIAQQRHGPVSYGELLVSVVGKLGPAGLVPPMSLETVGSVEALKTRLLAMKFIGRVSGRVVVTSSLLLSALVLIGLIPWRLVAAEPKAGEKVSPAEKSADRQAESLAGVRPDAGAKNGTEQAKVVAEIKNLGAEIVYQNGLVAEVDCANPHITDAGLEHIKGLTQLQKLALSGTQVTDAGLEQLKGLTQLQELNLGTTKVTDAGLKYLTGLRQLRRLFLSNTQVTDAGLQHLKGLTQLDYLFLNDTQVTDAGLEHLEGLKQLMMLDLRYTHVTNAGLEHLNGLKNLWSLRLENTQVADAGLENLKGRNQLVLLGLTNTQVTDAGLEHLKGLKQLQTLLLNNTQVTDAGLESLRGLKQLKMLYLDATKVTDAGIEKLQQALPKCEIQC